MGASIDNRKHNAQAQAGIHIPRGGDPDDAGDDPNTPPSTCASTPTATETAVEEPETDTATAPVVLEPEIPNEMEEPEELPTMADLFGEENVQEAKDGMASATQPAIQRSAPMAISDIEDQQKAQKREELQAKLVAASRLHGNYARLVHVFKV